ncbi:WSC domain-containing protein [Xylaria sp. FL0043]|nr:WSC domain-containing protein [Xylaria sp. FL0043]
MLRKIPFPLLSLILISSPILPQATAQPPSSNTSPSSSSSSVSTSATSTSTSTSTPSPTSTPPLQIPSGSASNYAYAGCWNETYGLAGTTGLRALDGASEVLPGEMTVEKCLGFCARGAYRLAGLEYSRECWCGDELNSLSVRLSDAACDTPCDGANSTACGGALKLTVYNSTAAAKDDESGAESLRMEGMLRGAVLGTVVWGLAFALG